MIREMMCDAIDWLNTPFGIVCAWLVGSAVCLLMLFALGVSTLRAIEYRPTPSSEAARAAVLAGTGTIRPDERGKPEFVWLVDSEGNKLEVSE